MDILKVFNMVVCNSKAPSERHGFNFDIFGFKTLMKSYLMKSIKSNLKRK